MLAIFNGMNLSPTNLFVPLYVFDGVVLNKVNKVIFISLKYGARQGLKDGYVPGGAAAADRHRVPITK